MSGYLTLKNGWYAFLTLNAISLVDQRSPALWFGRTVTSNILNTVVEGIGETDAAKAMGAWKVGTALGSGMGGFFDSLYNKTAEGIERKAGETIAKAESFYNKAAQNLELKATELNEKVINKIQDLLDEVGSKIDPVKRVGQFSKLLQDMIKKLDAEGITGSVNEQINGALDGLEVGKSAERIFKELGGVGKEALRNVGGQLLHVASFELLPYILGGMAALLATPLATYYFYQKAVYNIGRPKLATEVHQRTLFTPMTEQVKSAVSSIFGSKEKKPIFNAEINRRIEEISKSTDNIRKNGGYFQNVLFYGPGGTGKTMISEHIAKNSGMSYVKMSGGDLAQYIKRGEHVTELNKLLDKMNLSWRPWSTRPWILFIDEAESLCRDRSNIPTSELLELQNAFLNRTGTESNKFMVILSTNRMEDLDEAILSRMDHKIHIGKPAQPERVQILKSYIPQFFSQTDRDEFFTDAKIDKIARETNGLTGRALFKLLNAIFNKKAATESQKLAQPVIDQTIKDMVMQEKEIERRRASKDTPQTPTLGKSALSKRRVTRPVR